MDKERERGLNEEEEVKVNGLGKISLYVRKLDRGGEDAAQTCISLISVQW